ncbi:hypothetical protein [Sphingosinithalassobacter portus]|uniref:hypothetical protein n=1 Tax=Stakelama portus TaxID=2676234 RepID=UPI0011AB6991
MTVGNAIFAYQRIGIGPHRKAQRDHIGLRAGEQLSFDASVDPHHGAVARRQFRLDQRRRGVVCGKLGGQGIGAPATDPDPARANIARNADPAGNHDGRGGGQRRQSRSIDDRSGQRRDGRVKQDRADAQPVAADPERGIEKRVARQSRNKRTEQRIDPGTVGKQCLRRIRHCIMSLRCRCRQRGRDRAIAIGFIPFLRDRPGRRPGRDYRGAHPSGNAARHASVDAESHIRDGDDDFEYIVRADFIGAQAAAHCHRRGEFGNIRRVQLPFRHIGLPWECRPFGR